MNLLLSDLPNSVIDVNGTLYFDTDILPDEDADYDGECIGYEFATDYRSIINIMQMYESADELNDQEKAFCMVQMFYKDDIPTDIQQAYMIAMRFLDCDNGAIDGESQSKASDKYGRLFSFDQDGDYIYAALNYSHDDILVRKPNLHWWEFLNKFMQLKEDCKFYDIIGNRLAHKKKTATKEQKAARKEYPEIYVLKEERKHNDRREMELRAFESMLNG